MSPKHMSQSHPLVVSVALSQKPLPPAAAALYPGYLHVRCESGWHGARLVPWQHSVFLARSATHSW